MEYTYIQNNLLSHPQSYMYPPYNGIEFINSWRNSRMHYITMLISNDHNDDIVDIANYGIKHIVNIIKRIELKNLNIIECGDNINYNNINIEKHLLFLCNNPNYIFNNNIYCFILSIIRRFEVRKKLPIMYNGVKFNGDITNDILPYEYFSWILGFYASIKRDYKIINCLIKINDLLCSAIPKDNNLNHYYMILGLVCEVNIIDTILNEMGYGYDL